MARYGMVAISVYLHDVMRTAHKLIVDINLYDVDALMPPTRYVI